MRRSSKVAVLMGSTVLAALVAAPSAVASFHENLIREVHEGPASNGDYVELQARSAGQNFVAGKHIVTYDAGGGAPFTDFTIPSNVGNGANQATILIANTATVNGVTADFNAGLNLNVDNTGGTVCFTDSSIAIKIDCVAFDGVGGPDVTVPAGANFGTPFSLPGTDLDGQSLIRSISGGCATALDAADDTNTAADFSLGAGSPRNNSATPSETPCAPSTPATTKKKCKKKKHHSAYSAKKKKCKKKKHH